MQRSLPFEYPICLSPRISRVSSSPPLTGAAAAFPSLKLPPESAGKSTRRGTAARSTPSVSDPPSPTMSFRNHCLITISGTLCTAHPFCCQQISFAQTNSINYGVDKIPSPNGTNLSAATLKFHTRLSFAETKSILIGLFRTHQSTLFC